MKILFLALDINLGNKTGDSIHVRELATSFAKLGNEVFLITAYTHESNNLGWTNNTPNLNLFFRKPRRKFANVSTLLYCRKIAKKYDAQIIYERRNSPKIGFALSKLLRIPFVVEINALVEEEKPLIRDEGEDSPRIKHLKKLIRRHFLRKAKKIVTVTQNIRNEIYRSYNIPKERVIAIPNGANTDVFKPMDMATCRKDMGLNNDEKYICFTGNLAPWQGVNYMIDAMPLILNEIPNTRFLVVGGGHQKKALEDRTRELKIEKHVKFIGWVEYEEVPKYINACDICVAPLTIGREKSGSSAIKIYEYLACGKPVIAFDVPNLEFLRKRGCGFIVPRDDVIKLAGASLILLRDLNLRIKMGKIGRKVAVEDYSWTDTAKEISKLLGNLV